MEKTHCDLILIRIHDSYVVKKKERSENEDEEEDKEYMYEEEEEESKVSISLISHSSCVSRFYSRRLSVDSALDP